MKLWGRIEKEKVQLVEPALPANGSSTTDLRLGGNTDHGRSQQKYCWPSAILPDLQVTGPYASLHADVLNNPPWELVPRSTVDVSASGGSVVAGGVCNGPSGHRGTWVTNTDCVDQAARRFRVDARHDASTYTVGLRPTSDGAVDGGLGEGKELSVWVQVAKILKMMIFNGPAAW